MKEVHPIYIGADVHLTTHTFAAIHPQHGEIGHSTISNKPKDYKNLCEWLKSIEREYQLPVVIGIENSCGTGEQIAGFLLEKEFNLKEVNSNYTANRRNLHPHKDKSDLIDAKMISLALRDNLDKLGDVKYIHDSKTARALKELSHYQDGLAKERGALKNQLRVMLRGTYGGEIYRELFKTSILKSQISIGLFHEFPSVNKLKKVTEKEIINKLKKHSTSSQVQKTAKKLVKTVSQMTVPASSDLHVTREILIKQKTKRLFEIITEEKEIKKLQEPLLEKIESTNLLTLCGCGITTASTIVGETKDIKRFPSSAHLAKFIGVAPQECDSANKGKKKKSLSGNRKLYKAFYTIALSQIKHCPQAKKYFQRKIKEGKTKKQALTCLIRQLVNVVYAMMLRNEDWNGYEEK